MPGMICPYCKIDYPSDYKWCMEDGSELEQDMGQFGENADDGSRVPCPECGEPVDLRDLYCGSCATKLEGRLPQPEAQEEYEEPAHEEYAYESEPPPPGRLPPQQYEEEYAEQPAMATRPCPKCGTDVGLEDTFCGSCGKPLESAISNTDWTIQGRACPHCAGGLEPEDTFCGSCGHSVTPEVAPAPLATCHSCGMEISSDDVFCGTCGAPVQKQAPAPVADYAEAPAEPFSTNAHDQSFPAQSGSCGNCGMDISPGEAYCGTCGAPTSSAPQSAPSHSGDSFQQPLDAAPTPSISDFTKDIPVCPSCGLQGEPRQTTCLTCGVELTTEGNLQPGAPSSFSNFDDHASTGLPEVPDMGAATAAGGEKICSCCGVSSPDGAEFCGNCGIDF